MPFLTGRFALVATAIALAFTGPALAQKKYDPGATDTEIKVGNFIAYSGPASAFSIIAKVQAAYIKMLNENGGINGRKINFISYDDAYSPPKAVEQVRKLVENDEVLFLFQPLGTPSNTAVMKYMNQKKVPQIFVSSGGTRFGEDPKQFPWTMPFNPSYNTEGRIFARYVLEKHPGVKVAVLFQNDDFGKDLLKGFKDGLGDKSAIIAAEAPYDLTEPTVDSHILNLKASGAGVLLNLSTPKFVAQSIRKIAELGWKPVHLVSSASTSVGAALKPAGLENAQGIVALAYVKDPTDKAWANDPGVKEWSAFMDKYVPDADKTNSLTMYAYAGAQTLEHVLRRAGDDLTRQNIINVAASLKDFAPSALLPGIKMNTSATDYFPIEQMQLMVFKGDRWETTGELLSGEATR